MNLEQILDYWRESVEFSKNVTEWRLIPPKAPQIGPMPARLSPEIVRVLAKRGIHNLFAHQSEAIETALAGRHFVVVTPTASGKTLCYNLPVVNAILEDDTSRALYIFPTKALSQDQVAELHSLITDLNVPIKTYTYDGDTPADARRAIRLAGHVVVTNPEMLHTAILPHHTKWVRLFENLRFVVVDEMHHYRGVFGSHFANVLRRLQRICAFYGSKPQILMSSATIKNPGELASRLAGESVSLIGESGAPSAAKHFILYNPPVLNKELGIRVSPQIETERICQQLIANDVQTIVFAKTRMNVEIMLSRLQELGKRLKVKDGAIRGYRGGYLPLERREIERGLRDGGVRCVVSTNALELGIDIGGLECCVMCGYPGTVASTWQQAGRAGRRDTVSCAILVASSAPLDQFMVSHPDYFFSQQPESGFVNPDNPYVLASHTKCAAFEIPFRREEPFANQSVKEILIHLTESRVLHETSRGYHWMSETYPAEEVSLRSPSADNVVIIDTTEKPQVIGEIDVFGAMLMVHEEAIYIHGGQQYQVEKLDWPEKKAYVRAVSVDYYTDASLATELRILTREDEVTDGEMLIGWGDVRTTALATIYKKIRFDSRENVGWGKIALPENELHTQAFWLSFLGNFEFGMEPLQGALVGLSNLLVAIAPLYLLCDARDICVVTQVNSPETGHPTIFLYERCAGGVGMSEKMFRIADKMLATCLEIVEKCGCADGCPSCAGPQSEIGIGGKLHTRQLIQSILAAPAQSFLGTASTPW